MNATNGQAVAAQLEAAVRLAVILRMRLEEVEEDVRELWQRTRTQEETMATVAQEMTTVTVNIGTDARTFVLYQTNAPKAYDYGGAIELHDGTYTPAGGREVIERYVLLPIEAVEWQRGRNSSGLRTFNTDDCILDSQDLAKYLWQRLYRTEEGTR